VIVSATQSDPSPTAIPASAAPTGSVSLSSFVSGEIRLTVPSPALVTDTEPSPTAMPAGAVPTRIVSTTDPSSRSRRVTVPRSGCATHRLPNPVALAPGRSSSGVASCTAPSTALIRAIELAPTRSCPSSPDLSSGIEIASKSRTRAAAPTIAHRLDGVLGGPVGAGA
jgi:hypothetical protein